MTPNNDPSNTDYAALIGSDVGAAQHVIALRSSDSQQVETSVPEHSRRRCAPGSNNSQNRLAGAPWPVGVSGEELGREDERATEVKAPPMLANYFLRIRLSHGQPKAAWSLHTVGEQDVQFARLDLLYSSRVDVRQLGQPLLRDFARHSFAPHVCAKRGEIRKFFPSMRHAVLGRDFHLPDTAQWGVVPSLKAKEHAELT